MKTPWEYAKTNLEFSHQVALFQWAAMASNFGLAAANDEPSYSVPGHAAAFGTWRNDRIPQLRWLHAIKNQGHGDRTRGAMSAAEGVKAGVPDLFLPVPKFISASTMLKAGLYIELKRPKGQRNAEGKTSAIQDEWITYLSEAYSVNVCIGWEAARDVILDYLEIIH